MTDEIQPALSADEWAAGVRVSGWDDESVSVDARRKPMPHPPLTAEDIALGRSFGPPDPLPWGEHDLRDVDRPHAVAAACLFGQPFGFTQEDADLLRLLVTEMDRYNKGQPDAVLDVWLDEIEGPRLRAIAAKIAALLPPPEST